MSVLKHAFETLFAYLRYAHQRPCEVGHLESGRELRMRPPAVVRLKKVEDELALIWQPLSVADNESQASSTGIGVLNGVALRSFTGHHVAACGTAPLICVKECMSAMNRNDSLSS